MWLHLCSVNLGIHSTNEWDGHVGAGHPAFLQGAGAGVWCPDDTPTCCPMVCWCTLVHMWDGRETPTDLERKCCGQGPVNCISHPPHFNLYCLENGYLQLHRQYRNHGLVIVEAKEPSDCNQEFRYVAYYQYIFWQHGSLGQVNKQVTLKCCVLAIRDKYPDPHGQYTCIVPRLSAEHFSFICTVTTVTVILIYLLLWPYFIFYWLYFYLLWPQLVIVRTIL